jgi:hypothetical protein
MVTLTTGRPAVSSGGRARTALALLAASLLVANAARPWQFSLGARNTETPFSLRTASAVVTSSALPGGTILPVRLENTLSLKEIQKGQLLEGKVAQEIPLPNGGSIPTKSDVKGSIVSVEKDADGPGLTVTLKFNQLTTRTATLTLSTYLRAMASSSAVRSAQMPLSGSADEGTPSGWADTIQIGGDIRFGDGGAVRTHAKQKVGKGVRGGVLVHVRANPALGCEGIVNMDDRLQALWLFSSDACGVYDMKGTKIIHTGKSAPVGEISLHFVKEDVKVEAGTGLLMRVVSPQL